MPPVVGPGAGAPSRLAITSRLSAEHGRAPAAGQTTSERWGVARANGWRVSGDTREPRGLIELAVWGLCCCAAPARHRWTAGVSHTKRGLPTPPAVRLGADIAMQAQCAVAFAALSDPAAADDSVTACWIGARSARSAALRRVEIAKRRSGSWLARAVGTGPRRRPLLLAEPSQAGFPLMP